MKIIEKDIYKWLNENDVADKKRTMGIAAGLLRYAN